MRAHLILPSGALIAAGLATALAVGLPVMARAQISSSAGAKAVPVSSGAQMHAATDGITLAVGRGTMISLPRPMTDVFVANPAIANVQVRSTSALYVFGVAGGETSVYATDKGGQVIWSTNVRVGPNYDQLRSMIGLAMPDAKIEVTPMNGSVLLTGTVAAPDDVEEANRLVTAFVGENITLFNKLKTATPLQVGLRVRIAEVNRGFLKEVGVNLLTRDTTGGFQFGISRGRNFGSIANTNLSALPQLDASSLFGLPTGSISLPFDPTSGQFVTGGTSYNFSDFADGKTALKFAGKLFGLDIMSALDLLENDNVATTLAEPNLVALSGETASFLAGGEIPIPLAGGLGTVSVEYKPYGVGLAFTPTVLNDGRISMRVRPEVSQLDYAAAITMAGTRVPGLTTRRVETTVELGSGQSFMIGGLLSNANANVVDKAPFLGDLPIIGALFRSQSFRRSESELVVVVTPYLVKPVSDEQIKLPTDGYRSPTDAQRLLGGQTFDGKSGDKAKPQARRQSGAAVSGNAAAAAATPAPGFSLQ